MTSLIYSVIIGAIAGWLAGKIMKGGGFGFILNVIIGIIGGFVGNWIFANLGVSLPLKPGILFDLLTGAIGAIVILFVFSLFKKK